MASLHATVKCSAFVCFSMSNYQAYSTFLQFIQLMEEILKCSHYEFPYQYKLLFEIFSGSNLKLVIEDNSI